VELRPPAEIIATLDDKGALDGVPFMPEMLRFFGGTFQVEARVERACDTVNYSGVRKLNATVLLDDLRCDGSGHAGCQARCRLYWKEAWLRPATGSGTESPAAGDEALTRLQEIALANVHANDTSPDEPTYRCQATELLRASDAVGWWDAGSLFRELTSGNVGPWRFTCVMTRIVVEEIGRRLRIISAYPFRDSQMTGKNYVAPPPKGLQPGELVQIRPRNEIARTLNKKGKNKGLWFDREMAVYCGQTARVKAKIERFVDEGSGRIIELSSDCYILDDVVCNSSRSAGRWFCPRAIYPYWRECWLRPAEEGSTPPAVGPSSQNG
jgi:hypothetical protein